MVTRETFANVALSLVGAVLVLGVGAAVSMLYGVAETQGAHGATLGQLSADFNTAGIDNQKTQAHLDQLSSDVGAVKSDIEQIKLQLNQVNSEILKDLGDLKVAIAARDLDMIAILKGMGTIPINEQGFDAIPLDGQVVLLPSTVEQRERLEASGYSPIQVNAAVSGYPVMPLGAVLPSRP